MVRSQGMEIPEKITAASGRGESSNNLKPALDSLGYSLSWVLWVRSYSLHVRRSQDQGACKADYWERTALGCQARILDGEYLDLLRSGRSRDNENTQTV